MVISMSFLGTLQKLLGDLFDKLLSPVIRDVFNSIINLLGALLNDILSSFFLRAWITLLKLVDFLEGIFNVFSGASPIEVTSGGVSERMSLLDYFFQLDTITRAFGIITIISVFLAFFTTIIAVIRSMSDMALEDKHPISTVLKQAAKAAVSFMLIPFTCLFVLNAVSSTMLAINTTFSDNSGGVSDSLFVSVAAANESRRGNVDRYYSGRNYENFDKVKSDFNYKDFNYVQAYASCILVIFVMLCSILQFIQRIFTVLLLYLISPFFVAYMPLDEGAKFRSWRNQFVGHMVSAFGPIIVMRLYLMIVPSVMSAEISFGDVAPKSTLEGCIKLIFIIGGAFAVFKSRLLIVSLVDPSAAGTAESTGMVAGLITGGGAAAMSKIGSGIQKRNMGKQAAKAANSKGGSSGSGAFRGIKK